MDARPKVIYLPDTMVNWPWPQHLRSGCDLMNLFFIVEEYTDIENEGVTKEMVDIVLDALQNPHKIRPEGECILGEITRQFWAHVIQFASLPSQRHFLETFDEYINLVLVEAIDREQGRKRSLDDYLKLRRKTIGAKPCLLIIEMEIDLLDEAFYHPDMMSYNKEQAAGHEFHNLINIVMLELNLDRGSAMAWAAHYHAEVQKRFIDGLAKVPSWGPSIDVLVKEYLNGIANWGLANYSWSYESQRYFATKGPKIQHTRLIPLLPKISAGRSQLLCATPSA
ncbi:terpenoid synthase [Suillus plorans]|uniref:Terpene synthase n=1 Tax=Suillus plorans TaxID=116603 RepID=A0A9P7AQ47_9AGAM|nr:terpenoid synthase [Suillus plorans]KAG1793989.1 terpenoid synthase [Suillus plorans]